MDSQITLIIVSFIVFSSLVMGAYHRFNQQRLKKYAGVKRDEKQTLMPMLQALNLVSVALCI